MAFVQGQLITATELTAINQDLNIEYYLDGNTGGWIYWPSSAGLYCRNKTKTFYYNWSTLAFGGGSWRLQKLVDGTWTTLNSASYGWFEGGSGTISHGEGWYRLYFEGVATMNFKFFWSHYPSVKGSFLRYFNEYTSSGYTPGTKLTATILNSGRCGTIQ